MSWYIYSRACFTKAICKPILEEFVCGSCHSVFENPCFVQNSVKCTTHHRCAQVDPMCSQCKPACMHRFCLKCIKQSLRKNKHCPLCSQASSSRQVLSDTDMERRIADLDVKCFNDNCTWTGKLGYKRKTYDEHLLHCPSSWFKCKHCNELMSAQSLPQHVESQCKWIEIACPECLEPFKRKDLQLHRAEHCPMAVQTCICLKKILRKDMILHVCSERKIMCLFSGCLHSCKPNDMMEHQRECEYNPIVTCVICEVSMDRDKMNQHDCSKLTVQCKCLEFHKRSEMDAHRLVCKSQTVKCDFENIGCEWSGPRSTLLDHQNQNMGHHLALQHKRSVISFESASKRPRLEISANDRPKCPSQTIIIGTYAEILVNDIPIPVEIVLPPTNCPKDVYYCRILLGRVYHLECLKENAIFAAGTFIPLIFWDYLKKAINI